MKKHRHTLRKIVSYFMAYWKEGVALFLLIFAINIASLATPYILKVIIDDIFPQKDFRKLIEILLLLVVIYVGRVFMTYVFDVLYTKVSQRVVADIRRDIMQNVFQKPLAFFQEKQIGETIFILSNDVNNVQFSLSYLINDTLNNIILIISIIGIMLSLNVELTLISLSLVPLIIVFIVKFSPSIQTKFKKVQESEAKLFNCFTDELKNIRLIKSFATQNTEESKINKIQSQIIDVQVNNSKINSLTKNLITFIVATIPVVILAYGGIDVMDNTLSLGALIAYIQYINRLLPPVTSITNGYSTAIKSLVSMERINSFLIETEVHSLRGQKKKIAIEKIHKIELRDVSFSYRDRNIFNHVNLDFHAGGTYLITGESGSGKSTVLGLIANLLSPNTGEVIFNQKYNIQDIAGLSEHICLIEKDNQIFSDTVFNNVDYGAFTADELQIKVALQKVNLLEKVNSLELGLQTQLNSNMNTFSEGQRQRISLARAFMKPYSLIIIDEATASLDVRNERFILENLRQTHPHAIILIISHRHSFEDLCHEIFEFRNGQFLKTKTLNENLICV